MMILVAVASRYGSTREIAEAIGQELREAGHTVQVRSVAEIDSVEPYEAVVIGSAIYMGNWLSEAQQFLDQNRERLVGMPVWLFSSGPLGRADPQPRGDFARAPEFMQVTHAREHRIFVGKLDRRHLSFGARLMARVVRAPEGDFRDWEAIRGWAREIATALPVPATAGA